MANTKLADWIKSLAPKTLTDYEIGDRIPFIIGDGRVYHFEGGVLESKDGLWKGEEYKIRFDNNQNLNVGADGFSSNTQWIKWDQPV